MSAVRESHMPAPEITTIQNQGHCLPICICDTLIDLMCILNLKLHFSLIVPKKFIQHYVIKANVYSQIIIFTSIIYLYKSLFSYRLFIFLTYHFFSVLEVCYFLVLYFCVHPQCNCRQNISLISEILRLFQRIYSQPFHI